ncbi:MAG: tetratricopeptide repeat protein [Gemmatimonadota bacterium]
MNRLRAAAASLAVVSVTLALPTTAMAQSGAAERRALAQATELQRSGNMAEARAVLERYLDQEPTSASALVQLAQLVTIQGRPGDVLVRAERAVANGNPSPMLRQVWIRALTDAGQSDSALAAAQAWTLEQPGSTLAHGEVAEVLVRRGDMAAAVAALVSGRDATGDPTVFAQELGDLYARLGDPAATAREWVVVLGWGDAGVAAVETRLQAPGANYEILVGALRTELVDGLKIFTVLRSAAFLANRLVEEEWSLEIAETIAERVPGDTRVAFLRDYAADARNHDLNRNAAWAAEQLGSDSADPDESLRWRRLAAEWSLAAGDGPGATSAFEAIVREAPAGSEAHRMATSSLFSQRVRENPVAAEPLLRSFTRQYRDAEEDRAKMGVTLSAEWIRRGDLERAGRALDLSGQIAVDPTANALIEGQRGWLALYSGRPKTALGHLEVAALIPVGEPQARTEAIASVDAIGRADSTEAAIVGEALFAVERGDTQAAVGTVTNALARIPASEARPALLILIAQRLERSGHLASAATVYRAVVQSFPQAPEAAPGMLALARSLAGKEPSAARQWLKKLILDHPSSALAPVARRLLSELEGRVPSSSSSS